MFFSQCIGSGLSGNRNRDNYKESDSFYIKLLYGGTEGGEGGGGAGQLNSILM